MLNYTKQPTSIIEKLMKEKAKLYLFPGYIKK
jgi:hypothetical protein